ncbi:MAG: hypothetical protein KF866_11655 [Phycisphaeraceae bacterium]|nr:hypothetical protein [Phycisphaeraceae bacterium]
MLISPFWRLISVRHRVGVCLAVLAAVLLGGCNSWPNSGEMPPAGRTGEPSPRILGSDNGSKGGAGGPGMPGDDRRPEPNKVTIGRVYDWISWAPYDDHARRGFSKPTVEKGHFGVLQERLDLLRRMRPDGSLWSHPHGNPKVRGKPMKFTMLAEIRQIPELALMADLNQFRRAVDLHTSVFGEPPVIYTGSIRLNPEITLEQVDEYGRDLHQAGIRRIVIDSSAGAPIGSIDWQAVELLQARYGFRIGCEPWPNEGLPSANLDVWVLDVPTANRRNRPGKVRFPPGEIVHMHMTFDRERAIEQLADGESVAINLRGLERDGMTVDDLRFEARLRALRR